MRFGLMTNEKRSWSKIGQRTKLPNQLEYSNRYMYSALSPIDGDSFHIIGFSEVNTQSTNIFLDELKKHSQNKINIIIWDNAVFHKPSILHSKKNILVLQLPSYA